MDAKDSPQAAIEPFEDHHNYVLPPQGKLKTSNSPYAVLPLDSIFHATFNRHQKCE